jgi:hypothetical protein
MSTSAVSVESVGDKVGEVVKLAAGQVDTLRHTYI